MSQGDPLYNAWHGCLGPIVRNILLTGLTFLVAAIAAAILDNFWVFLIVMFAGATLWWTLERTVFADRKRLEDRARAEFFGLDE